MFLLRVDYIVCQPLLYSFDIIIENPLFTARNDSPPPPPSRKGSRAKVTLQWIRVDNTLLVLSSNQEELRASLETFSCLWMYLIFKVWLEVKCYFSNFPAVCFAFSSTAVYRTSQYLQNAIEPTRDFSREKISDWNFPKPSLEYLNT